MGKKLILLAVALIVSFATASAASADDFTKAKRLGSLSGFRLAAGSTLMPALSPAI